MIGKLFGGMLRGTVEVGAGAGNILGAIGKNVAREYMGSAGIGTAARAAKEAAYQETKKKALSFLNRRVAPAALAYGGGQLAGAYIESRAEERRAYYGEKTYRSRYGTSADTAASLVRGAGSMLGVGALMGMTPSIRRGIAEFGPRRALKAQMRSATKEMDKELRSVARHRAESQFFNRLLPQRQPVTRSRFSREERAIRKKEKAEYRELKRRQRQTQKNMETEIAKPSSRMDPLAPFTVKNPKGLRVGDITPQYTEAGRKLSTAKKALEAMGPSQFGFIRKAIKYGSAVGAVGAITEPVLNNPIASFATGVGVVAATAAALRPMSALKFVRSAAVPVGVGAATIATGAALGSNIPAPPAAEGNIEEAVYNRTSPVRKLNYSTAGLVQSIHNNRRMR